MGKEQDYNILGKKSSDQNLKNWALNHCNVQRWHADKYLLEHLEQLYPVQDNPYLSKFINFH